MRKRLWPLLGLMLLLWIAPQSAAGPADAPSSIGHHPRITHFTRTYEFDYRYREWVLTISVDIIADGNGLLTPGTLSFASMYPHGLADWTIDRSMAPSRYDGWQVQLFQDYTLAVLSCLYNTPAAQRYDDDDTHNPSSPISIEAYAYRLWGSRLCPQYGQTPPPPLRGY